MAKRNKTEGQTTISKTLHRKLQIQEYEHHVQISPIKKSLNYISNIATEVYIR